MQVAPEGQAVSGYGSPGLEWKKKMLPCIYEYFKILKSSIIKQICTRQ